MSTLNPQQRQAIEHIHGPLLVLAGAGSGKTRVITEKIAHLIGRCRFDPRTVAALTFTNKAAREMQARLGALMPKGAAKGVRVSTFHSLGLTLVRAEHGLLGYKAGFTLFDAADAQALINELAGGRKQAPADTQPLISQWKSSLVEPEQALQAAEDDRQIAAARLYALYQRHLRAYNAVDFDDLIRLPTRLFQADSEALERWRNRLHYLLVDEYQDTNTAQYQLFKLLAGPRGAFTVVGDDDQSIYAWRGARPENLGQLRHDFPTLEMIKLEQNYRSHGHILQAANGLIERNARLFEKRLWSAYGPGDRVRVLACADGEAEAERVVAELLSHRIRFSRRLGDYAILYRSNHQARPFERVLRERNVAYRLSGGQSFFERSEVKDVIAYLRLLTNPDDDAAFLRIVNVPRRELGAATLEKLGAYAQGRRISLFQAAREIGLTGNLPERPGRLLRQFADWAENLARRAESEPPAALTRQLLADIDYSHWLQETHRERRQAEKRLRAVDDLINWMARLSSDDGGGKSFSEVVSHLGLMDILERRDDKPDSGRVHLMTLHAAKGLEFDHVFLVGVEEDTLPHRNSIAQDTLEEERRLLYVGITRARRSLTLTFARQRRLRGEAMDCEPSRFLEELPQDVLAWEGKPGTPAPAAETRQRGEGHLAALRDLLDAD